MQPTVFEAQNKINISGLYIIKDSFEKYIDCQQIKNEQRNYKFNVNHNNLLTKGDIFLYYSDSKKINVNCRFAPLKSARAVKEGVVISMQRIS